jgi:hypothetical protein
MYLATCVKSFDETRTYLERVVAIDPASAEGLSAAEQLKHFSPFNVDGPAQPATGATIRLTPPPPLPLLAAGGEATPVWRSLSSRLMGVALFQASAYRQIADDPTATRSAGAVMLVSTALVVFVSGLTSDSLVWNDQRMFAGPLYGLVRMLIEVSAGLVSWVVSSAVGSLAAIMLFRGRTNTAEMLRALGYASVFRLLWLLPCGFAFSWLLSAVGTVIAVREAAEFDTSKAMFTAAIAWAVAFAVSGLAWLVLNFILIGLLGSA